MCRPIQYEELRRHSVGPAFCPEQLRELGPGNRNTAHMVHKVFRLLLVYHLSRLLSLSDGSSNIETPCPMRGPIHPNEMETVGVT